MGNTLPPHLPPFVEAWNAGVYLANFPLWREAGVEAEAAWWLERKATSPVPLWRLGTQPIMHLIFGHDTFALDAKYNCQVSRLPSHRLISVLVPQLHPPRPAPTGYPRSPRSPSPSPAPRPALFSTGMVL